MALAQATRARGSVRLCLRPESRPIDEATESFRNGQSVSSGQSGAIACAQLRHTRIIRRPRERDLIAAAKRRFISAFL